MSRIAEPDFHAVLNRETAIMDRLAERLKELGGFTQQTSKALGWRTA